MSQSIEASDLQVWIGEDAYKPGQRVPDIDELGGIVGYELAGGSRTEIIQNQRFRDLGHGPTESELRL